MLSPWITGLTRGQQKWPFSLGTARPRVGVDGDSAGTSTLGAVSQLGLPRTLTPPDDGNFPSLWPGKVLHPGNNGESGAHSFWGDFFTQPSQARCSAHREGPGLMTLGCQGQELAFRALSHWVQVPSHLSTGYRKEPRSAAVSAGIWDREF